MRTKKIIAGVCASMMLAATAIPTVTAAESVSVTLGNTTAAPGGTFTVEMELSDIPSAGINACDFGIKYDSSVLTITGVEAGSLAQSETSTVEGMPDPLEYNVEDDLVSVIYGLGTSGTYMTGSGTFLVISGTVSDTAAAGTKSELEIVAVDRTTTPSSTVANTEIIFGNLGNADDAAPVVYDPTFTNGYVEILGDTSETTEATETTEETTEKETLEFGEVTMLGDATVDGSVDSSDIIAVNKIVLSRSKFPLKNATANANADCDSDGDITSKDAMAIINHVLQVALLG